MTVKIVNSGSTAPSKASKASKRDRSGPIMIQKVINGETFLVLSQSQYEPEDDFKDLYFSSKDPSKTFLQPPFEPKKLKLLSFQNNILAQCIEAMEVNVDGTGHEFVATTDGETPPEDEVAKLKAFFEEPFPGTTFEMVRRELRRELEQVGWAFLEVLVNPKNELVGVRNITNHSIRYVRLDEPVLVTRKIQRGDTEVEMTYWARERRFVQTMANAKYRYFKEWGSTRELNCDTGDWETQEKPVPLDKRATSLIPFVVHDDVETPYGLPRWINQTPSVIGSRKAEEDNLSLVDSGGLPPAIIFIEGGTLGKGMADSLKMYLSGQMKNKNRAIVVDAQPSGGTLDATSKVTVKVEKFGSESTKDSMYSNYDKTTEEHVRVGFRIPPLFIGKAADYSYASASTSYMVAEAQVFMPERSEFDTVVNRAIVQKLGVKKTKFKSRPITLKDVASQIKGLELAKDISDKEKWTSELNKVTDLTIVFSKEEAEALKPVPPVGGPAPLKTGK